MELPLFSWEDYKDVYLGKFIEENLLNNQQKREGGYSTESGSIKNKPNFCNKETEQLNYRDVPEAIQKSIEQIYNFIKKQNL